MGALQTSPCLHLTCPKKCSIFLVFSQNVPNSSGVFPFPDLEPVISPRILHYFYGKLYLEIMVYTTLLNFSFLLVGANASKTGLRLFMYEYGFL